MLTFGLHMLTYVQVHTLIYIYAHTGTYICMGEGGEKEGSRPSLCATSGAWLCLPPVLSPAFVGLQQRQTPGEVSMRPFSTVSPRINEDSVRLFTSLFLGLSLPNMGLLCWGEGLPAPALCGPSQVPLQPDDASPC